MVVASGERTLARRRGGRVLIALLLSVLALIPVMHIAVITQPSLDPTLGIFSSPLAIVTGVGAVFGMALIPLLDRLGRVGAILFAFAVAFYTVGNGLGLGDHPNFPTGTALDIPFALLMPAGYLVLLMGALRSAGWVRQGAIVVAVAASACVVITVVAPPGPWALPVDQMANRIVYGSLFAVAAVVAIMAALIERVRHDLAPETAESSSADPSADQR